MYRRKFLKSSLATASLTFSGGIAIGREVVNASLSQKWETIQPEPWILNSGIGGNNTVDLLGRIEKDCLAHKPDMTLLMIGTNDMHSKKFVSFSEYEKNLREIIKRILAAKSQIMLMTILPLHEPYLFTRHDASFYEPDGVKKKLDERNQLIRKIADEYQLHFLDTHHVFTSIGDVGEGPTSLIQNVINSKKTDGLHPTPEGYRTMAVAIYEALIRTKASYKRLVCFGDSITFGGGGETSYPAYLKRLLGY